MPPKDKYTDPKLRDKVKEEVKQSDKGGAPGQWSARKAQFMAQEYKRRGGGYTTEKSQQDQSQENLEKWTEEEWQTKEGSGHAKRTDGTQKRYLPKKAWEKMTEEEKEATDEKKKAASKKGKQFVSNTETAKQSRKQANEEKDAEFEQKKTRAKGKKRGAEEETAEHAAAGDDETAAGDGKEDDQQGEKETKKPQANTGQKRKSVEAQQTNRRSKRQKSNQGGNAPPGKVGSKHMDATEPAPRGSVDRLPKKGQNITWKAMPGYVDGIVQEVLTKGKSVDGKSVKASKDDPKIILKSNSSGKICVHKPDVCFFE